jgi:hypothetical protein
MIIAIIEWGGGSDQSRRLYEGGVNESWTKVDHEEEGVIRVQGRVDVFCAQPLIKSLESNELISRCFV